MKTSDKIMWTLMAMFLILGICGNILIMTIVAKEKQVTQKPSAVSGLMSLPISSATLSTVNAGPGYSVTVLAQKSSRQGAIFSRPIGATSSVNICYSSTCSATTGISLGVPTTTQNNVIISQDALYTGIVTSYAAASGTQIMVTEF